MADNPLIKDLCKLFKKFNKEELLEGLIKQGFLKEGVLDTEGTKKTFVIRILKKCFEKNVTAEHVALMDLMYHQSYPNCKKWTVYKLLGFDPKKELNTSDPWKFRSQLKSCLGLYFNVEIYVHLWRNGLWTRIHFCNRSSTSLLSNNVFIIYYPNSEYVFMSTIKAAHKQFIFQTLSTLLHSQTLEEVKLSGRDMPSLRELVLNKNSQTSDKPPTGMTGVGDVQTLPLDLPLSFMWSKFYRKLEVLQSQEITSENWAEEQKRQQLTDGAFGTNLQPKLERIEFKMQTRLQSRQQFPQLISPISCNVRFEGSSVIEGIKNLGSQSFVDIPLPSYMTNLHSLSRSSLLLKEKKKTLKQCLEDGSN